MRSDISLNEDELPDPSPPRRIDNSSNDNEPKVYVIKNDC